MSGERLGQNPNELSVEDFVALAGRLAGKHTIGEPYALVGVKGVPQEGDGPHYDFDHDIGDGRWSRKDGDYPQTEYLAACQIHGWNPHAVGDEGIG